MWKPITRGDFENLLNEQKGYLTIKGEDALSRFGVPIQTAKIFRSVVAGDELVFVVAKTETGVLFFDDVEWGFEFASIDASGRILKYGAGQMDLAGAVETWLVPLMENNREKNDDAE